MRARLEACQRLAEVRQVDVTDTICLTHISAYRLHRPPLYPQVDDQMDEMGYHRHIHIHTPFTPPPNSQQSASNTTTVYTSRGGGPGSGLKSTDGKKGVVSSDEALGRSPGTTTCTSCQQQVMTIVTYKVGRFAKLICLLLVILGLLMCLAPMVLLPIPFCVKKCKDVHHTCPHCDTILHVDKKQCCK
ncbi:lipopolysaccharide-induced tumor necrosis factor-alpha factor homolog [Sebastes umbrosus]|uniref:lipopolysaccharide-induced tumor necrosis factor-alpha factor homolog n=1 Tax=Sebastes umbrosus TaxID=72105 RepID=UPI00189EFF6B|nr:lipopolysaccharide-induced tumor necrosis factor-alpha factor homolog [Sebastes umbrosus]